MSENNQLNPANGLTILIDKLSKDIFDATVKSTERAIIEDKRLGIVTEFDLEFLKGNLNQFDKLIFFAICSEYSAGNEIFSIRRLWRKIGGSHTLTDEMKKLILDSVERLACTRAKINMTPINDKHHYTDEREMTFNNYLLPCKSVTTRINGQLTEGIFQIIDKPPLLEIAELKKQFATFTSKLLDVPKLRNTELTLKLKSFLFERIIQIVGSYKQRKKHFCGKNKDGKCLFKGVTKLSKTILFEKIFEQCELSDADRNRKSEYRKTISKIMDHFQKKGLISEWNFEKKDGKFYAILIDF